MENILSNIMSVELDKYKCPICHDIPFPPVKWFIEKPYDQHTPLCNHIYCLECTRIYFQLNKKISERTVNRYECLLCQQQLIKGNTVSGVPKNASDVYYHCNSDDCRIIKLLIEYDTNGFGKKCPQQNCSYRTCCPEEMKFHCRDSCLFTKIKCPHPGCFKYDYREVVNKHIQTCTLKPIQCKLCKAKSSYHELVSHYQNYHKIYELHNNPLKLHLL